MFLSCSSFQEHSFHIPFLQWKFIVTQFVLWCYFLKSRIDSDTHLTSLGCSRLDFWRSLVRLCELLLSSFHPDIFVCHLFGADTCPKQLLPPRTHSVCLHPQFCSGILCLSIRCGHRVECLSLFKHCIFLNCAF